MYFVRIFIFELKYKWGEKKNMHIPACTCWPLTVILGSEAPSCIHPVCISIYPFLYYHDNLCWTQGLEKLMFPANSHALFTRSVIFILHLFVIFMASHSQDSITAFMRSLIANWDCHHLKHLPGISMWLIMYKCLLANLRPLITKPETHLRMKSSSSPSSS